MTLLRRNFVVASFIIYSSLAQLVEHAAVNRRVVGSSPTGGAYNFIRLLGQAVKTSPFHGGNTGSSPVGVIFIKFLTIRFQFDIIRES